MMEKLLSVADMMARYQCSRQTAIRYMQKMEHQEKPYMVRQSVVEAWDRSRTVRPAEEIRAEMMRAKMMRRMA